VPAGFRAVLIGVACTAGCECGSSPSSGAGSSSTATAPDGGSELGGRRDVTALFGRYNRATIADVDGDGRSEVVVVDAQQIRILRADGTEVARGDAPGGIQVLAHADLDRDGRAELLTGWGSTLDRRDGMSRASIFRLGREGKLDEDLIMTPATDRREVVALVPGPEDLLVAAYESKYIVRAGIALRTSGGWANTPIASMRMATAFARGDVDGDGRSDVVVGRVYGDDIEADGDAFVLRPDAARVPIPTTRGVRSLAVADIDGDGIAEVILGDGWHKNYGKLARSLLSISRWQSGAFHTELIDEIAGQPGIDQLVIADLDGDGASEIVTRGEALVRAYRRGGERWIGMTIAERCRDVAAGDLDGEPGDELLVIGDQVVQVRLRGVTWE
jgi:hypothetical protein